MQFLLVGKGAHNITNLANNDDNAVIMSEWKFHRCELIFKAALSDFRSAPEYEGRE